MKIIKRDIIKFRKNSSKHFSHNLINDSIIIETPLKIYLNNNLLTTTMITPSHKENKFFTLGYLFTEGYISSINDVEKLENCKKEDNRVNVFIKKSVYRKIEEKLNKNSNIEKNRIRKSSCGICGYYYIDHIEKNLKSVTQNIFISIETLYKLKAEFEKKQKLFQISGASHSSAIFNNEFKLIAFSEDVGRHNAIDKAIGIILYNNKNYKKGVITLLSSRISFEMVYKAIRLNTEILAGFSTVTSSAIELAEKFNLTLIGFFRDKGFNVYTGFNRISIN